MEESRLDSVEAAINQSVALYVSTILRLKSNNKTVRMKGK